MFPLTGGSPAQAQSESGGGHRPQGLRLGWGSLRERLVLRVRDPRQGRVSTCVHIDKREVEERKALDYLVCMPA